MSRRRREPTWLTVTQAMVLHAETLGLFGGKSGLRDKGLLESAIARPQQIFGYEEDVSLFDLAAGYCYGLCRNHPFVDGNKRTGVLLIRAFLFMNGFSFVPVEAETVTMIEMVASDEITEASLSEWIEQSSKKRGSKKR
ncbi:MAG: type II toxin-antitoxin system death-on-curing family toxin [Rhodothermales bacterium]|nr:type II toxin-antitoxin system death-on-curing family toxin [Rhodothermales bacterium]